MCVCFPREDANRVSVSAGNRYVDLRDMGAATKPDGRDARRRDDVLAMSWRCRGDVAQRDATCTTRSRARIEFQIPPRGLTGLRERVELAGGARAGLRNAENSQSGRCKSSNTLVQEILSLSSF